MRNLRKITDIDPTSDKWLSTDNIHVAEYFETLDFRTLQEILYMRVFDLMNLNHIDPIRAEEVIVSLYKYLNPNREADDAIYWGTAYQAFDYTAWRVAHKNLDDVTVADLVLAEGINLQAIQDLYDAIRKKFFKSSEYDWRKYKFANRREYREELKRRNRIANGKQQRSGRCSV